MTDGTRRALVIGSGLAGLSCAHRLAGSGVEVTVLSPGDVGSDGATHRVHALAPWVLLTAPWSPQDSAEDYRRDLAARSGSLVRRDRLEVFCREARAAAHGLLETLDLEPIDPQPTSLPDFPMPRALRCRPRHRRRPMLGGLVAECRELGVDLRPHHFAVGLQRSGSRIVGAVAFEISSRRRRTFEADAVVLATGGIGAVFPICTEPRWCRGSGLALATLAGAGLYHPHLSQALPVREGSSFFPSTRALLEGRIFVDGRELAPSGSLEELTATIATARREDREVELEPSFREDSSLRKRLETGPRRLALRVALHQGLGGVRTDLDGRASLPGLYACGEAAGGFQGRSRVMGTGLLEARIFGLRTAEAILADLLAAQGGPYAPVETLLPTIPDDPGELERRLDLHLGRLTSVRPPDEVERALREIEGWASRPREAARCQEWFAAIRGISARAILESELAAPGQR